MNSCTNYRMVGKTIAKKMASVSMSVYEAGTILESGTILAEGKLKRGRFHGPVRMFAQVNLR